MWRKKINRSIEWKKIKKEWGKIEMELKLFYYNYFKNSYGDGNK